MSTQRTCSDLRYHHLKEGPAVSGSPEPGHGHHQRITDISCDADARRARVYRLLSNIFRRHHVCDSDYESETDDGHSLSSCDFRPEGCWFCEVEPGTRGHHDPTSRTKYLYKELHQLEEQLYALHDAFRAFRNSDDTALVNQVTNQVMEFRELAKGLTREMEDVYDQAGCDGFEEFKTRQGACDVERSDSSKAACTQTDDTGGRTPTADGKVDATSISAATPDKLSVSLEKAGEIEAAQASKNEELRIGMAMLGDPGWPYNN